MATSQTDPAQPDRNGRPPTSPKRDRTHWLYIGVIIAVLLGIAVGFLFPDFAVKLQPLADAFIGLIKMMISPVIFCTIVIGIGSVRKAASVGKVGGLALGYFLAMSTFALAIGLFVGNVIQPGSGLHITGTYKAPASAEGAALDQLAVPVDRVGEGAVEAASAVAELPARLPR